MCAHTVRVGIEKVRGVEAAEVSLNEGLVRIRFAPKNDARLEELVRVVEHSGFTPKEARVIARGRILLDDGKLRFQISGSEELYALRLDSDSGVTAEELKAQADRVIQLGGVLTAPEKKQPWRDWKVTSWELVRNGDRR